jgi:hypothetical protein
LSAPTITGTVSVENAMRRRPGSKRSTPPKYRAATRPARGRKCSTQRGTVQRIFGIAIVLEEQPARSCGRKASDAARASRLDGRFDRALTTDRSGPGRESAGGERPVTGLGLQSSVRGHSVHRAA